MSSPSQDARSFTAFNSFGAYLTYVIELKRRARPNYNQSQLGRLLGIRSTALMSMIMNDSRMPSRQLLHTMARRFSWSEDELLHAYLLCDRAANERRPEASRTDMQTFVAPLDSSHHVKVPSTSVAYQPLVPLLAELARVGADMNASQRLRQRARLAAKPQEVTAALDTLVDLGLLRRDPSDGLVRAIDGAWRTDSGMDNMALRRYHQAMMAEASAALDALPVDERVAAGMTVAIRPEQLPQAVKMINDFFRRLSRLAAADEASEVFHFAVQGFPLTQGAPSAAEPAHSANVNKDV